MPTLKPVGPTKWVLRWDLLLAVVALYLWEPHHSSTASREMFVDLGNPRFPRWPGQGRIGVLCLSRENGLCGWREVNAGIVLVACRCGIDSAAGGMGR